MKKRLLLAALAAALFLAGCGQARGYGGRELQARLAALVADPVQCPSGSSADVQALINAAGPDGIVHIPAGCYEIAETIGISSGKPLYGPGMDQTIFYRDPETFRDQDKPMIWVFGRAVTISPRPSWDTPPTTTPILR
jgi:predicted small secreted protein